MDSPLPNTYWVLPGRLLAGEYPYGADDADTCSRLGLLHQAGLDYFIDLTEVDECPDYRRFLPRGTEHVRFEIPDACVPAEFAGMQALQSGIRAALGRDQGVYVHCRAGIGRTGVVIGCYLAEEGRSGKAALKHLNRLWRQSARSKSWPTVPQTAQQADYIRCWPQHRQSP